MPIAKVAIPAQDTVYRIGSDNESVNRCHQIGSRSQIAKITNSDRRDNIVIGTSIMFHQYRISLRTMR